MNPTPEPTAARPEDDPRLLRAAQEYLAELEAGRRPRRTEFVARFPDIAGDLAPYLDALDMVHGAAPPLTPAPLPSGERGWGEGAKPVAGDVLSAEPLGDYRIVREIGRGGMGIVYEAVQLSLGRRVALKVLPFAAALDAKQLHRFQNEAQAAAQLHHTNIVPVYAVGCERGVHYYAMQLIEGYNLADLIAQMRTGARPEPAKGVPPTPVRRDIAALPPTGPYPAAAAVVARSPDLATIHAAAAEFSTQRASRSGAFYRTAARLAAQAAEALEHAHQFGVIHRDVKPANLMVDARGNLWVTDFGLAQFHNRAGLTRTGDLLGTLRYMSPEQVAGQGAPLDPRTDVYSLGATLYELLTLEPLFDGADHAGLLRQILYDEPRPLRALERSIPPELETIVLKAVAKNPADRYATAREFADDLHRFLDNKPIRARRPTAVQRVRKWSQRHPSVVVAAVVLCLLTAAGSLASNGMLQVEQKKTRDALAEAKEQAARAEEARVQAEKRLQIAREAVDEMIQVSEEELLENPGTERARNRLLESALKYYQQLIDQRRDDPGAQAELAATKVHVQKILADLAALQGAGQFNLLNSPDVLADLHATEVQKDRIADLCRRQDRQQKEMFDKFFLLSPEERRKRFLKLADLAGVQKAAVNEILTARQVRRLRQIDLQLKGPFAFHDPEVVAVLKLTAEQQVRIWALEGNPFDCGPGGGRGPGEAGGRGGPGGRAGGGGRGGPGVPGRDPDQLARSPSVKIQEVLTTEQAALWKEMTGEPFTGRRPKPFGFPPGGPSGPPPPGEPPPWPGHPPR